MRESSSTVDIPTGAGGNREVPINLICGAGLQATEFRCWKRSSGPCNGLALIGKDAPEKRLHSASNRLDRTKVSRR